MSQRFLAIVGAGSHPKPAPGPFETKEECLEAFEQFEACEGAKAGEYLAAGSVGIRVYETLEAAHNADVSDVPGRGGCTAIWTRRDLES